MLAQRAKRLCAPQSYWLCLGINQDPSQPNPIPLHSSHSKGVWRGRQPIPATNSRPNSRLPDAVVPVPSITQFSWQSDPGPGHLADSNRQVLFLAPRHAKPLLPSSSEPQLLCAPHLHSRGLQRPSHGSGSIHCSLLSASLCSCLPADLSRIWSPPNSQRTCMKDREEEAAVTRKELSIQVAIAPLCPRGGPGSSRLPASGYAEAKWKMLTHSTRGTHSSPTFYWKLSEVSRDGHWLGHTG